MRTKRKLKTWVKQLLVGLGIGVIIFILLGINSYLDNEMETHIERVSEECAKEGYGIVAKYTKEGEKYYVCKK